MHSIYAELIGVSQTDNSKLKTCVQSLRDLRAKARPLPDFDEVNCKSKWVMTFPGGHELSTECNKITVKVNFGFGSAAATENLVTGEWSDLEIEAGIDVGSGKWVQGQIEVGAEAGAYIKIGRRGISEWGVKGGAKAEVGRVKVISAESKVSITSGKAEGEVSSDFTTSKIEYK
jgi:hypothetical protein